MIIYCLVLVMLTTIHITTFHYKHSEYMHVSKKDHPFCFLYGASFFLQDFIGRIFKRNGVLSEKERRLLEKLSKIYTEINPVILLKLHKAKRQTMSFVIIYFVAIIGILLSLSNANSDSTITSLDRPTNGEDASSYELNVEIDGETTDIILEIESKSYTLEEVLKYFDSHLSDIESSLLKDNASLFEITSDLHFISEIDGIHISWQPENYDYINERGEILMNNISDEGISTSLFANLKYGGHSATITFPLFIIKTDTTPSLQEEIISEINKINDPMNSTITLPDSINGTPITFTAKGAEDEAAYFF